MKKRGLLFPRDNVCIVNWHISFDIQPVLMYSRWEQYYYSIQRCF